MRISKEIVMYGYSMEYVAAVIAWGVGIIVGYVYLGYPLILWLLTSVRERKVIQGTVTPPVTLLISAFNEEKDIRNKLENSLTLDYPRDHLEVIVISDASTDSTDQIVQSFADKGVRLLRMPQRGGKTLGLNAAMAVARGECIVFSDANIMYRRDTLRCLVRSFVDPLVGCVTGDSRYVGPNDSPAHVQESNYWRYEQAVRILESKLGSTVGADGAIFAIRRQLYTPLVSEAINDFVTPLQIVARGYRAIFDPEAVGFENTAGNFSGEFRRKRRIVNRSWRGLMNVPEVLKPWCVGLFAWQVWSHKVLRWLILPFLLLGVFACYFATPLGMVYKIGLLGWFGSILFAVLGALRPQSQGILARIAHGFFYFYLVNLAAMLGIVMAVSGRVETVWTPERQTGDNKREASVVSDQRIT